MAIDRRLIDVQAPSAIHPAATDHGELMTLASKRQSLLMAADDNEMYNKKPQRYAEGNIVRSGKTEAQITIIKTALEVSCMLMLIYTVQTDTKHRASCLRQQSYLSVI